MNLLVTDDKTQDSYMLLPKARLARSINKNNVVDGTSARQDLLTKYTLLSRANVMTSKNETWSTFAVDLDDDGKCKIHNR